MMISLVNLDLWAIGCLESKGPYVGVNTINPNIWKRRGMVLGFALLIPTYDFIHRRAPPKTPLACGWDSGRSKPATLYRR